MLASGKIKIKLKFQLHHIPITLTRVINNQCTHLNVLHRVHFGDVWDKHMGQFRIKPVLQKWISHVYICNKRVLIKQSITHLLLQEELLLRKQRNHIS